MGEYEVRKKIVDLMQSWLGIEEGTPEHKFIIDTYNGQNLLPRNYAVKYTDAWCATTISSAAMLCGYTDIIPLECSCGHMIELAKEMGCWEENDGYIPKDGDIIMYDWDDSGVGNNTGWPEHVGMVHEIVGNQFYVIEGNYSDKVKERIFHVNSKNIRGYVVPNYASKTTKNTGGWRSDNIGWWYRNDDGSYKKNEWADINGCRYYFNKDGYAVTDWNEIDGKWYYFEPEEGNSKECALYVSDSDGAQSVLKF